MYVLELLASAEKELGRLDKSVGQRIVGRLRWLAAHFDEIKPERLSGDLAGFLKLRAGDYRVIYEVVQKKSLIVVHFIGHRREVYRRP